MENIIEIIAFALCSGLCILVTMAVINMDNRKEFNLSRENSDKLESFGNRLSNWKKGDYNPIMTVRIRKRG